MTTEMKVKVTRIGECSEGIDGRDEYLLVKRLDDNILTPAQAREYVLARAYRQCYSPGGYYCTSVKAVQVENSDSEVICTVEHRYDV